MPAKRFLVLIALVLLGGAAFGHASAPAGASEWWCWDDPVLVLNGQTVHVRIGVPDTLKAQVTLADVVITVPVDVDAKITAVPAPHFPQQARLIQAGAAGADGTVTVGVQLMVAASVPMDVGLSVWQSSGEPQIVTGPARRPLAMTLTLPGKNNAGLQPQDNRRRASPR